MWKGVTVSHAKRQQICVLKDFSVTTSFFIVVFQGLVENKAQLRTLHSCCPLNRGKNNRRSFVGAANKWPRPLNRGGR